ncbi:hypothetical protein [Sinosporangium album]|uniref:hypothetical protein n=1 Tax=Sinosporangium album TaxID=504805 RepID=UPI0015A3DE31
MNKQVIRTRSAVLAVTAALAAPQAEAGPDIFDGLWRSHGQDTIHRVRDGSSPPSTPPW